MLGTEIKNNKKTKASTQALEKVQQNVHPPALEDQKSKLLQETMDEKNDERGLKKITRYFGVLKVLKYRQKKKEKTTSDEERRRRAEVIRERDERVRKIYGISPNEPIDENFKIRVISLVLKRRWLPLLLMTMLVAAGICGYYYIDSMNQAKATMMLNYEESAKGLAPNSTRFNISSFTSEEVMENVIKNAGLENVITPQELANRIGAYEVTSKMPVGAESYYIPTSYKIYYENPREIKDITAQEMLKIICDTYTAYFHENYSINTKVLKGEYANLPDLEYAQIGSLFSLRIDEIICFLDMRSKEGGKFKSESTGETFNSIKKLAENVRDYTLNDYNAYIWENGIVKDPFKYTNTLMYLNDNYYSDKIESFNEYEIRRDTIGYFSTGMSTSILIPTTNNAEFYMARTKTGVDHLATKAEYYLGNAKSLELKIQKGIDRLSKLKSIQIPAEVEKANGMITNIQSEIERIEKLAVETNKEFTENQSKNFVTFQNEELRISDRIDRTRTAVLSLLFLLLAFFVYYRECSSILRKGAAK